MSKKLAIKGHPTRGKEVIELLEMMGGKNIYKLLGNDRYAYCVIEGCQNEIRVGEYIFGDKDMCFFTLEEFLEKYPFKVGDKVVYMDDNDIVVISEIKWDNTVGDVFYNVKRIDEDECFLCPPELLKPFDPAVNHIMRPKVNADGMLCYKIPEGYESFSIQENMIILKPKKPKYPKTYKECRAILNYMIGSMSGYKSSLLANLQSLLICRDAYWKIAGVEMGLEDSWKYDMSKDEFSCAISYQYGCIEKNEIRHKNAILAFPTKEMRDTFYENFKNEIEDCKELL